MGETNLADNLGNTPLHGATLFSGNLEICRLIMEKAGEKNPANNNGSTPLHWAAYKGNLEICRLILVNVQVKNPADNSGKTPLDYAKNGSYFRGDYVNVVRLIQDYL